MIWKISAQCGWHHSLGLGAAQCEIGENRAGIMDPWLRASIVMVV